MTNANSQFGMSRYSFIMCLLMSLITLTTNKPGLKKQSDEHAV